MGQKNENDTKTIEERLAEEADKLQESIRYYGKSKEWQEEVRKTVYQAGRVIGGAANLVWTIAKIATDCIACKFCDYYEAGQKVKNRQYKEAGQKIAEIQLHRVKGTTKAATTAASTICYGVKAAYNNDTESTKKFRHGLRNCTIIGGMTLLASEGIDAMDTGDSDSLNVELTDDEECSEDINIPNAYGAEELFPITAADVMPGVEDGLLIDDSPSNLAQMAQAGEFNDTQHLSEVMRSYSARMEFLAQHDLERIPSGWEMHHIVPLCEGGADAPDNMVLLRAEAHDWITNQHRLFYGWPGPESWG